MSNLPDFRPPNDGYLRTFAIRVPARLQREIEALAVRDVTTLSATLRRLVVIGLRSEQRRDAEAEPARRSRRGR